MIVPLEKRDQARRLRRDMTDAERKLWASLRGRALSGAKFRRQQAIGPYIVDFHCSEQRLVIELDGGQHAEEWAACDRKRSAWLEARGYRVIRFWNSDVMRNLEGVLQEDSLALLARENDC
jgi:adenine-specific DNA-methyltransferase